MTDEEKIVALEEEVTTLREQLTSAYELIGKLSTLIAAPPSPTIIYQPMPYQWPTYPTYVPPSTCQICFLPMSQCRGHITCDSALGKTTSSDPPVS